MKGRGFTRGTTLIPRSFPGRTRPSYAITALAVRPYLVSSGRMLRGEFAGFFAPGFHCPQLSEAETPATTPHLCSLLLSVDSHASIRAGKGSRDPFPPPYILTKGERNDLLDRGPGPGDRRVRGGCGHQEPGCRLSSSLGPRRSRRDSHSGGVQRRVRTSWARSAGKRP